VATVPTVADLRAKRIELTLAAVRERIEAGDLEDVRVVVQSLASEFELADVAAAAVKLVHAQMTDGAAAEEPDVPVPLLHPDESGLAAKGRRPGAVKRAGGARADETARIFIGAGRQAGIRPADLIGAIANEAGLSSRDLGIVQIADRFAIVEVPAGAADAVIDAMRRTSLRGQRVTVRRDRDS
jgi:ATP-dependent RNA helicase DeaD